MEVILTDTFANATAVKKHLPSHNVRCTFGGLEEFPKNEMAIDVEKQFKPKYKIPRAKRQLVAELKRLCQKAVTIHVATDTGIIGEYVAWRIVRALKLDMNKTKRLRFTSLTEPSLKHALHDSSNHFDLKRIEAFQARLVCDRLVRFQISPLLSKFAGVDITLGRRQASVLGCLSRARERLSETRFDIILQFYHGLSSSIQKQFETRNQSISFLERVSRSQFRIARDDGLSNKTRIKPFTTYSLIRYAHKAAMADVSSVLEAAWRLYHFGKITFILTDSELVVKQSLREPVSPEISGEQSIRVTNLSLPQLEGNIPILDKVLYCAIWKHTMYSQLGDCITRKLTLTSESGDDIVCEVSLSPTLDTENPFSKESISDNDVRLRSVTAYESKGGTISRYDLASFNDRNDCSGSAFPFDNLNIPGKDLLVSASPTSRLASDLRTRHSPISCDPQPPNSYLTPVGEKVTLFLSTHFPKLISDDFIRTIECKFKDVELGKDDWTEVADFVQKTIYPAINKLRKGKAILEPRAIRHPRALGFHPSTKEQIKVVKAKYGPCLMMGRGEQCLYFKITRAQYDTLHLETALPLLDRRRHLSQTII